MVTFALAVLVLAATLDLHYCELLQLVLPLDLNKAQDI